MLHHLEIKGLKVNWSISSQLKENHNNSINSILITLCCTEMDIHIYQNSQHVHIALNLNKSIGT